uniref:Uncharacterized protein n=1 Tax=Cacopsylla melanoneura TaxID=428564 RepID=A0A8D8RE62_9HEMI
MEDIRGQSPSLTCISSFTSAEILLFPSLLYNLLKPLVGRCDSKMGGKWEAHTHKAVEETCNSLAGKKLIPFPAAKEKPSAISFHKVPTNAAISFSGFSFLFEVDFVDDFIFNLVMVGYALRTDRGSLYPCINLIDEITLGFRLGVGRGVTMPLSPVSICSAVMLSTVWCGVV